MSIIPSINWGNTDQVTAANKVRTGRRTQTRRLKNSNTFPKIANIESKVAISCGFECKSTHIHWS